MFKLNGLFIDESLVEINSIKRIFDKNNVNIKSDSVNSEEKFMKKLANGKYDIVISNYPNKSLNFMTLLGLYEVHGKNIPLIVLIIENSVEDKHYKKNDSGRIFFLNKGKIDETIPKIANMLKLVH